MLRFALALMLLPLTAAAQDRCRPGGGFTCAAHWEGYEYDAQTGSCDVFATSGCANPFSYETLEACRQAHPDSDQITCKAYWSGFEFDQVEGLCKAVSASGCANPFRFQSMRECNRYHSRCRR